MISMLCFLNDVLSYQHISLPLCCPVVLVGYYVGMWLLKMVFLGDVLMGYFMIPYECTQKSNSHSLVSMECTDVFAKCFNYSVK